MIKLVILIIYYFLGPRIILLIYKKEEFLVSRTDTTLLALVYSFYLLGLHFTKIMMVRNTPGYSSISLAMGISAMFIVLFTLKLPPMKLVGISLLVCNFFYFSIQCFVISIIKIRKNKKLTVFKKDTN